MRIAADPGCLADYLGGYCVTLLAWPERPVDMLIAAAACVATGRALGARHAGLLDAVEFAAGGRVSARWNPA